MAACTNVYMRNPACANGYMHEWLSARRAACTYAIMHKSLHARLAACITSCDNLLYRAAGPRCVRLMLTRDAAVVERKFCAGAAVARDATLLMAACRLAACLLRMHQAGGVHVQVHVW